MASTQALRSRFLDGPILPTFVRLALPTLALTAVQLAAVIVETYFIGRLGTAALAGVALVVPLVMLMQMMSAGAMGGGMSSAVARALGGGKREAAESLAWHALVIAIGLGLAFSVVALAGGPWLYALMGGQEQVLASALAYSNALFGGAVLVCAANGLASVLRGTGDMRTPAWVLAGAAIASILLTPILIGGWGPLPAMGIAGAGAAIVVAHLLAVVVFAWRFAAARTSIALRPHPLRGAHAGEILKVGIPACIHAVLINTSIAILTGYVAVHGTAALAGYGIGARLEYLQIPIAFGLGAALVAMVGTNVGAGQIDRARRIAWTGGIAGAILSGSIGLVVTIAPDLWSAMFTAEPAVRAVAAQYFRIVGPAYIAVGFGMALYFSFQGTGRMTWPLAAIGVRLTVIVIGCTVAGATPAGLFGVAAVALVVFGAMYALATWRFFGR